MKIAIKFLKKVKKTLEIYTGLFLVVAFISISVHEHTRTLL